MGGTFREMTGALFPGQGSERKGMSSLVKAGFKKYLDDAEAGALPEISSQLALYAVSASLWEDSKKDYAFSLAAGHSLGFYTALFAAGCIDFETGIFLIRAAHKAISAAAGSGDYGMTAIIGIKSDIIDSLCRGYEDLHMANINSATQVVVSGAVESLGPFEEMIAERGALRILRLPVRYPLHTPMLRGASDIMKDLIKGIRLKTPGIPVVDHTSGEILASSEKLTETLTGQFSKKVIWRDVIVRMRQHGINRFVEVGPGETLSKLTRWIERDVEVISLDAQV